MFACLCPRCGLAFVAPGNGPGEGPTRCACGSEVNMQRINR